jgi:hypothetical protein
MTPEEEMLRILDNLEYKLSKAKDYLPPDQPLSPGLYKELNEYFFNDDDDE